MIRCRDPVYTNRGSVLLVQAIPEPGSSSSFSVGERLCPLPEKHGTVCRLREFGVHPNGFAIKVCLEADRQLGPL